MTTYYIKQFNINIDSTLGNDSVSEPPIIKMYNASTLTGYVPGMVNDTQHCFKLMEEDSNTPFFKNGYGTDVNENYTEISINKSSGQYMLMGDYGIIVLSDDYGDTWNYVSAPNVCSCAVSYTGQRMIYSSTSDSKISSNYGVTWSSAATSANNLRNLCMSSDGSKVVGHTKDEFSGKVYRSTDYGYSFTEIASDNNYQITSVSCSSDGSKITYTTLGSKIYVSTNSGTSFSAKNLDRNWTCVCMSEDGVTQFAGQEPGDASGTILKSTDTGENWSYLETANWVSDISCDSDGTNYEWVGLLYNKIDMSGDGVYRVKTILDNTVYNYHLSTNSGTDYAIIGLARPSLYTIHNVGGDYGFALDLEKITYNKDIDWRLKGWSTPGVSGVYTATTLANQMCDYFEDSKYKITGASLFSTVNLYFLVCTINGDTDPDNICYIPVFYFGNNPSDPDRTYVT